MHFSIIIPFYNVNEVYLEECLKSISIQVDDDDEVIIINDGSKYFPYNLLNKYKYMNIQYIEQENRGVSIARNVGIDKAENPFIIFIDPDDKLYDNAISNFRSMILKNTNVDMILSYHKIKVNGKILPSSINRNRKLPDSKQLFLNTINIKEPIENVCIVTVWAKAFRKEFLISNNIKFDKTIHYSEDRFFMMNCYHFANNISLMDEYTYIYWADNINSVSNCYNENIEEERLTVFHRIERFINDYYKKDSQVNEAFIMMIVWSINPIFGIKYCNINRNKNSFIKDIKSFKKYLIEVNFYKYVKFKHAKLFGIKGKLTVFLIKTHQIYLLFIIRKIVNRFKRLKNN